MCTTTKIFMIILFFSAPLISGTAEDNDFFQGYEAYKQRRYDDAIRYFERAAKIYKDNGNRQKYGTSLNNIGSVYKEQDRYDRAMDYFKKALAVNEELGDRYQIAILMSNIGMIYNEWGQYDRALLHSGKARAIFQELGKKRDVVISSITLGRIYFKWNLDDQAMESYKQALAVSEELGDKYLAAAVTGKIGEIYLKWGRYNDAMDNYTKALAIFQKLGTRDEMGRGMHRIGWVYYQWGQYDKALEHYEKAQALYQKLGMKSETGRAVEDMGWIYHKRGQHGRAIENFEKSLAVFQKLGEKWGAADSLISIGLVHYDQKKYDEAIRYFLQVLNHIEEIRKTAAGEDKRDFFASVRAIYGFLISSHIRNKAPEAAFNTVELSSARYLLDQLGERLNDRMAGFADIKEYRKNLGTGTAIISYSNVHSFEKSSNHLKADIGMAQMFADRTSAIAREADDRIFTKPLQDKYSQAINTINDRLRGLTIGMKTDKAGEEKTGNDFIKIINYYRYLLSRPEFIRRGKRELTTDRERFI